MTGYESGHSAPTMEFTYTAADNVFFRKNAQNYITEVSVNQLNTLQSMSLLDIFLSAGNVIEPHYHQNASEMVYMVSGEVVLSLLNPSTQELQHFTLKPGQVANIPQGWWHYEVATADNTHMLAIFDAPVPEVIFGSDILRMTPPSVLAHTYCLDEAKVKETLAPITETVVIGPPNSCSSTGGMTVPYSTGGMTVPHSTGGLSVPHSTGYHSHGYMNQPRSFNWHGEDGMAGSVNPSHPPLRPIACEPYAAQLDQPFHPIPFLYRRWV
ncbi:cupin domain-containing protein [Paenibacillus sp. PL2-23]|uniref:cupin domain-containing protein n=1 Tax=Paenibacillus sp. PL2-23 TaxID=2100729 RepID=UPI0030F5FAA0